MLQSVRITPQLEVLPVFVRGGSILPFAPLVQSTKEKPGGPLLSSKDAMRLHVGAREGSFLPWWSEMEVKIFAWNSAPGKITHGGAAISNFHFDVATHSLTISLPEKSEGGELDVAAQ